MACIEAAPQEPQVHADSEMEEGEIVDDYDNLSDISSEEEYLLRKRLEVLENYNNVLERKKTKRQTFKTGKKMKNDVLLCNLSGISASHLNRICSRSDLKVVVKRGAKRSKSHHKIKRTKSNPNDAVSQQKRYQHNKRKNEKSRTSDDSDCDEYRNKRRKLQNAVTLSKAKSDSTSLKDRLTKMLLGPKADNHGKTNITEEKIDLKNTEVVDLPNVNANVIESNVSENSKTDDAEPTICELIELSDEETIIIHEEQIVNSSEKHETKENKAENSDEDIESLRQLALKTKNTGLQSVNLIKASKLPETKSLELFEDEDSDTAELRLICLKSALLKKAIEMKQKQRKIKRLSQSSNFNDEFILEEDDIKKAESDSENNTDIENIDMDIGSDVEDKAKENVDLCVSIKDHNNEIHCISSNDTYQDTKLKFGKEDDMEEDEDLLRAKLLTSLSKNLPNLVDLNVVTIPTMATSAQNHLDVPAKQTTNLPEEKKFIINLQDSDSEGENEATKNLTKMHMKLSEQAEFQQKLDLFLKSTRMKVEKDKPANNTQKAQTPEKYGGKALNNLPKSEQIEYRNLVKRMSELEKIKQARQNAQDQINAIKDTLKPRNVTVDHTVGKQNMLDKYLEEKIAISRKHIADESTKMLKLKEEARKLSQKYKIVATELRNISTAITLNKKQQRNVHSSLMKIRHQHQLLLKSTNISNKHSSKIPSINRSGSKATPLSKLQKENDPLTEEHKNLNNLKSVKVSVVNDIQREPVLPTKLSIHVDISGNKKITKMPKSPITNQEINKDCTKQNIECTNIEAKDYGEERNCSNLLDETEIGISEKYIVHTTKSDLTDYKSPLDALGNTSWEGDPNTFLCPFEVGGSCRDPDCKYLHPKVTSQQ